MYDDDDYVDGDGIDGNGFGDNELRLEVGLSSIDDGQYEVTLQSSKLVLKFI